MDENDQRFVRIDERFTRIDERFTRIDERFVHVDERFTQVDERLEQTRQELRSVDVRLTRIETRLEQTVTKADLEKAINSVIKWMVGTMFGAAVVAVTVMTFVLNNAIPKQPAASMAPLIIQLPPSTQTVPGKAP
jgi:tetrahydromethanopterin S-methyltransferase subunit G